MRAILIYDPPLSRISLSLHEVEELLSRIEVGTRMVRVAANDTMPLPPEAFVLISAPAIENPREMIPWIAKRGKKNVPHWQRHNKLPFYATAPRRKR